MTEDNRTALTEELLQEISLDLLNYTIYEKFNILERFYFKGLKTIWYKYKSMRSTAKTIKRSYGIMSFEDYLEKIISGCHYCKAPLIGLSGYSIDRKIPEGYYTSQNSVGCCKECNFIKRKKPYRDFVKLSRSPEFEKIKLNVRKGWKNKVKYEKFNIHENLKGYNLLGAASLKKAPIIRKNPAALMLFLYKKRRIKNFDNYFYYKSYMISKENYKIALDLRLSGMRVYEILNFLDISENQLLTMTFNSLWCIEKWEKIKKENILVKELLR